MLVYNISTTSIFFISDYNLKKATPKQYTTSNNYPCYEDGTNCGQPQMKGEYYIDPSYDIPAIQRRLKSFHV